MTLINVTAFTLGGNHGSEKDIDPPLFTDKVLHKNVHPLSQFTCQQLKPVFMQY